MRLLGKMAVAATGGANTNFDRLQLMAELVSGSARGISRPREWLP